MFLNREYEHTANEYFAYTPEDHGERYELIEGEFVALAAPNVQHQRLIGKLFMTLASFINSNNGKCEPFVSPFDVKLDAYNVVQPDVLVVCNPEQLDDKRCYGAPDFVIEVTSSDTRRDFYEKLALYSLSGVREYWIVDPKNEKTVVYFFEKSDLPNIYTFDTPIPVGIYDGQLTICIAEL